MGSIGFAPLHCYRFALIGEKHDDTLTYVSHNFLTIFLQFSYNFLTITLALMRSAQISRNANFLLVLILKNGFVGDIGFSGKEEIFTKSPLALF
jgi:hypothetical protein